MSTESVLKSRVRNAWEAAWDRGDVDALDGILAPGYERSTAGSAGAVALAEFKASISAVREAFPDLSTTVEVLVEEDDGLAIFWRSAGTHLREFRGVPATNRPVLTQGANYCTLANGQISGEQVTWNSGQLLTSLGITSLGED